MTLALIFSLLYNQNVIHTLIMKMSKINAHSNVGVRETGTVRITVSVPYLVDIFLKKQIPKRQVSQFVSDAISKEIPLWIALIISWTVILLLYFFLSSKNSLKG